METYGFNSKKYTTLEYSSVGKTKQNRSMFLSNYAISGKKKSTFIKNKEVNKPDQFKMNKIVNKFLLTGDTFILELHSKQPEFTYSA